MNRTTGGRCFSYRVVAETPSYCRKRVHDEERHTHAPLTARQEPTTRTTSLV